MPIGYGPPGSDGQLPGGSHDENAERLTAEEYSRHRRRPATWLAGISVVGVLVICLLAYLLLR